MLFNRLILIAPEATNHWFHPKTNAYQPDERKIGWRTHRSDCCMLSSVLAGVAGAADPPASVMLRMGFLLLRV